MEQALLGNVMLPIYYADHYFVVLPRIHYRAKMFVLLKEL